MESLIIMSWNHTRYHCATACPQTDVSASCWNMSQKKKQTARKTTGTHLLLSSALSPAPPPTPARRQSKKRVQHRPPTKSPLKSILKRPSAAVAPLPALLVPTAPSFASSHIDIDIPDDPEPVSLHSDAPPSANGTLTDPAPGPGPGAGAGAGPLIAWRRPALHVLDPANDWCAPLSPPSRNPSLSVCASRRGWRATSACTRMRWRALSNATVGRSSPWPRPLSCLTMRCGGVYR
ncbi:hypothetical protein L210DRAFT_496350 [Boletus edulis BED1]|uniref:Uncharacterized protein n=1 Tax=Boletus edulis BED1 TaxID=1328754 RepID=A0AAD4GG48_BOLED|nr:hypothetical protein L210DRAFT_496350 [Boletus edulis BED1]